jgi:hypothetical protein
MGGEGQPPKIVNYIAEMEVHILTLKTTAKLKDKITSIATV